MAQQGFVPRVDQNLPPMASGYSTFRQVISDDQVLKSTLVEYKQQSIVKDITSSNNVPSGKISPNTIFQFKLPLSLRLHRNYEKSQNLETDRLEFTTVQMNITRSNYSAMRFDILDTRDPGFPEWMTSYKNAVAEAFAEEVDRTVLTELPQHAHPCNKGPRAGKVSGSYDMGMIGKPLPLNKDNILIFLAMVDGVLAEQNVPDGDRFIVFPRNAAILFGLNDLLLNPNNASSKNLLRYGKIEMPLYNFTLYFTNRLPRRRDPVTQETTYLLIAGTRDATGLVEAINHQSVVAEETQLTTFDSGIKNLFVWDFLPIRPDSLVAPYVKIVVPTLQ